MKTLEEHNLAEIDTRARLHGLEPAGVRCDKCGEELRRVNMFIHQPPENPSSALVLVICPGCCSIGFKATP